MIEHVNTGVKMSIFKRKSADGKYDIERPAAADLALLTACYDTQLEAYGPVQQAKNNEEIKQAFVLAFRQEAAQKSSIFMHADKHEVHILGTVNTKTGYINAYQRPEIFSRLDAFKP